MGLDNYQCYICRSPPYEAEYLFDIPIKAYNGDSVRVCCDCRHFYFTKSPRHGYVDVTSFKFIAHDGTEFTDFSDLSEYLETHPGEAKAECEGMDKFMDADELYNLCEHHTWEQQDHDEENTKWTPDEEFWQWEKRTINADLERLKKRQKIINDMI